MKALKKFRDWENRMINLMIVITFAVLIAACVLQVFTRYILNASLSWTEELARYMFIWTNLLGATVCVRKNSHARVTALYDIFPEKIRPAVNLFTQTVIIFVAYVMIRYGLKVFLLTGAQKSPAMHVSMALVYFAVPFCGIFIMVDTVIAVALALRGVKEEEETV